jgi:hypothetical protein
MKNNSDITEYHPIFPNYGITCVKADVLLKLIQTKMYGAEKQGTIKYIPYNNVGSIHKRNMNEIN